MDWIHELRYPLKLGKPKPEESCDLCNYLFTQNEDILRKEWDASDIGEIFMPLVGISRPVFLINY